MMFRTTSISLRRCRQFILSHSRLVLFLALLLAGIAAGCCFFSAYGRDDTAFLSRILTMAPLQIGFRTALSALYHSCFLPVLLLLILFVCGLSACGLPVVLIVPFFFGLGIGMSEAYYYSTGWRGVLTVAVLLLPQLLIKSASLLMASAESMRMTLLFSGQLLPQRSAGGGMNQHFRLYVLRFFIFLLVALAAGVVDVLLRFLCQSWLL